MSEENKKPEPKPEPEKTVVEKEAEIVSIHDFKSMLVGMDMVLGDDWTPTEAQWKRIRKKLDALIETAERPITNTRVAYPQSNINYIPVDSGPNISDDLLRNFPQLPVADVPIGAPGPTGPSALTPPPNVPPQRLTPPAPMDDGSGAQVKTPDIDSSQGYKSSFV